MFKFELKSKDPNSRARAGLFDTPHGQIETPIFMPVGTLGSIKGVSMAEVDEIGAQIILANTYHLYLRPGHKIVENQGALHNWTHWRKPILTDSGGFQVFSLGKDNVKIFDHGVEFKSHLDGSKHFFDPQNAISIQHALGADIIMQIDVCAPHNSSHFEAMMAMRRTHDWAQECKKIHQKLEEQKSQSASNALPQALFPIVQGVLFDDLRVESAKFMADLDLPGVAIGGLSVGEERPQMHHILEKIEPHLPETKPRYLMGVGTPIDLLESIDRGMDMFDCVHATRIARHGHFYDLNGRQNIKNARFINDNTPLSATTDFVDFDTGEKIVNPVGFYAKSYIHHLIRNNEMLGLRIMSINNLFFLIKLCANARKAILAGKYAEFKKAFLNNFAHSV